jgi:mono/diheme cytochrome c family protein
MERSNSNKNLRAATAFLTAFFVCAALVVLLSDHAGSTVPQLTEGARIYTSACAACHGPDGKGTSQAIAGFERPDSFPDFSRCDQTSMEEDSAYRAVVTYGGPYRGFSQIMPSFGKALTQKQIFEVVHYLRSFCDYSHWPRGELNVSRAIATEKAYPEDEEVITAEVNARGTPGVTNHIIHEQRFGQKYQLEVDLPLTFQDQNHTWYGGVSDTVFGVKRVLYSNLRSGSIFAAQGEISVPTGNRARGFGSGTTTFGVFGMYDQLFRENTFLQFQGGGNLPVHPDIAPQNVFFNSSIGQMFAGDKGNGRLWSPMVEFLASRDLMTGAKTDWDVLPQVQVTLSPRQHIRADLGVRVPMTDTAHRPIQIEFYVLWDWADGKLTEGW